MSEEFEASERLQRSALFLTGLAVLYWAVLAHMNFLEFDLHKDEQQFWRQTAAFAEIWPPGIDDLRHYDEPMTPAAFLLWGFLESTFHQGPWLPRATSVFISVVMLMIIGFYDRSTRTSYLAAVGMVIYPYYIPLSVFLYTDMLAAFFVLLALRFGNRPVLRASFFVLAISTRQYMVVFPAALLAWQGLRGLQQRRIPKEAIPDAVACASLLAWIAFFGGIGPSEGLNAWPRHQNSLGAFDPMLGGYFLTTMGLYFVIPETILYTRFEWLRDFLTPKAAVIAIVLGALFFFFPPIFGELKQGLFGRVSEFLPTAIRVCVFYVLALIACVRFSRIDLAFWLVLMQFLVTLNAWSAWEKYLLGILVALWFLRGSRQLDGVSFPSPRPT